MTEHRDDGGMTLNLYVHLLILNDNQESSVQLNRCKRFANCDRDDCTFRTSAAIKA